MRILLILLGIVVVFGEQVFFNDTCKIVARRKGIETVPDFDIQHFGGVWYEIKRYENSYENGDCICSYYKVADINNRNLAMVTTDEANLTDHSETISHGYLVQETVHGGKLNYTNFDQDFSIDYWVLSYNSMFILVYSCRDLPDSEVPINDGGGEVSDGYKSQGYLWILSRTISLSEQNYVSIRYTLNQFHLDMAPLINVTQDRECDDVLTCDGIVYKCLKYMYVFVLLVTLKNVL